MANRITKAGLQRELAAAVASVKDLEDRLDDALSQARRLEKEAVDRSEKLRRSREICQQQAVTIGNLEGQIEMIGKLGIIPDKQSIDISGIQNDLHGLAYRLDGLKDG